MVERDVRLDRPNANPRLRIAKFHESPRHREFRRLGADRDHFDRARVWGAIRSGQSRHHIEQLMTKDICVIWCHEFGPVQEIDCMTRNALTFEVLRDGELRPLSALRHAPRDEQELQRAWKIIAEHMHADEDADATTGDRDARTRFLIVPQREMEDHVLLIVDGRTWKVTSCYPYHAAVRMGRWLNQPSGLSNLLAKLSVRASERSEERIQSLLDVLIDADPFQPVEAKIDTRNAELRKEFVKDFPVLDSATVHKRAGLKGINTAQTVNSWRKRGRILGLPIQGKYGYPEFQFDADGQPLKLMKAILDALPKDFTPWQRAFWLVSPKEELDGDTPEKAMRDGNDRVVEMARSADQVPVG